MVQQFQYVAIAQEVLFGAGKLDQLARLTERLGLERMLLCTSGSYVRNGITARVEKLLGDRLVACYDRVQPHVPEESVAELLVLADREKIDGVIGLGGGSAVGTAKAVAVALEGHRTGRPAPAAHPGEQPLVPVIAIPTTYAGSEMTPIYGVTRTREGRKETFRDLKVTPRVALYDPELTLDLPPELTAATGINALAHCIEGIYSINRTPLTTATALVGIDHINRALPTCVSHGKDLAARTEMLVGAYLAGTTIANAKIALHHGICHMLGGMAGVPHGVANSIMLPHVMRFNLPACAPELAAVARAMGVDTDPLSDQAAANAAIDAVSKLIGAVRMPRRLRDVGLAEEAIPRLAKAALESESIRSNPLPVTEAAQVETLLRAAW